MRIKRVLIADDHADVRSALRLMVEHALGPGLQLTESSHMAQVRIAASKLQPDLILLDWELAGLDGGTQTGREDARSALAELHGLASRPVLVVLSGRPEARALALSAGADAFICKADSPELLRDVLYRTSTCDRGGS